MAFTGRQLRRLIWVLIGATACVIFLSMKTTFELNGTGTEDHEIRSRARHRLSNITLPSLNLYWWKLRDDTIYEFHIDNQQQLFPSNEKNMFNTANHFLINHRDTCQVDRKKAVLHHSNAGKLSEENARVVVFLIISEPKNWQRRNIIRQTWLNTTNVDTRNLVFRNLFVMGKPSYSVNDTKKWQSTLEQLKGENKLYNDILVGDFVENYWNLTYKTMFAVTWANFFCKGADFLVKIDDDILVLQKNFFPLLQTFPKKNFYGGKCEQKASPHRQKKNKWYISEQEFPSKHYPPFCFGPTYFFSTDLLPHIFNATLHVNYFKLEDVYMGLCLEHAGKKVQTVKGVTNWLPKYDYCTYKDLSTIHGTNPTNWTTFLQDIAKKTAQNFTCPKKKAPIPEKKASITRNKSAIPENKPPIPEKKDPIPEVKAIMPEKKDPIPEVKAIMPEKKDPIPEVKAIMPEKKDPIPKVKAIMPEKKDPLPEGKPPTLLTLPNNLE